MRTLIPSIAAFLLSFNLMAADTSGCTLTKSTKEVVTAMGNRLQVQNIKAPWASCWNAKDDSILLSYEWLQSSGDNSHNVIFWTRVNQAETTVQGNVSCSRNNDISYSHNTSGESIYRCQALAKIVIGHQDGMIIIEVAPQIDNSWDTRGFSQNYLFKF